MQLEGAVVSRPMPWTSLCCSELHRCIPVVLPVGQPGAPAKQHKPASMARHWTERCGNSAACLLSGWVARQSEVCYDFTMFLVRAAMHRGSFRNDDILMSRTVLQSVSRANQLFECHTTTALVLWQMQSHFLDANFCLHVAQLCGYY